MPAIIALSHSILWVERQHPLDPCLNLVSVNAYMSTDSYPRGLVGDLPLKISLKFINMFLVLQCYLYWSTVLHLPFSSSGNNRLPLCPWPHLFILAALHLRVKLLHFCNAKYRNSFLTNPAWTIVRTGHQCIHRKIKVVKLCKQHCLYSATTHVPPKNVCKHIYLEWRINIFLPLLFCYASNFLYTHLVFGCTGSI